MPPSETAEGKNVGRRTSPAISEIAQEQKRYANYGGTAHLGHCRGGDLAFQFLALANLASAIRTCRFRNTWFYRRSAERKKSEFSARDDDEHQVSVSVRHSRVWSLVVLLQTRLR